MKILVLCTGNSCRSQMAEGYLRHFAKHKATIYSAGIAAHGVNPKAIAVMKEDGINISHHLSKNINEFLNMHFDHVITVCDNAKENCPVFYNAGKMHHYNFPDPALARGTEEEIMNEFRKARDMIKNYCKNFISIFLA